MERDEIFTHDELITALLEAQDDGLDDSGVVTGPELAEMLDISHKAVLRRVKLLLKAGTIEVAKKRKMNSIGVRTTTRGYRLAKKQENQT